MASRNDVAVSPVAEKVGQDSARVEISGLTKRFLTPAGEVFTALQDVSFTVEPGQFCAVVGPTGCGKSTTLSMVSGLDRPSEGSVKVGGREVDGVADGVSFMFQTDALLPWKTVLGNVLMGPVFRGVPKQKAQASARDWLRRVGLTGFEDRYPHQLSGGMRKRVAMAAALINEPKILIMDEPFGALDVQTKAIMSTELLGPVGADPPIRHLHHPRPRRGRGARRPGRRDDVQPRLGQGGLRHRPAAPARLGPGDPLPAPFHRTPAPDLGYAAGGGGARLRTHRRR